MRSTTLSEIKFKKPSCFSRDAMTLEFNDQMQRMNATPNHSVEPTCHGKPCHAAHLGR